MMESAYWGEFGAGANLQWFWNIGFYAGNTTITPPHFNVRVDITYYVCFFNRNPLLPLSG